MRTNTARMFIEVTPDEFVLADHAIMDAERLSRAAETLKARLRDVIGGLAPIMSEDVILRLCKDVLAEDA